MRFNAKKITVRKSVQGLLSGRFTLLKALYLYAELLLSPAPQSFRSLKNKHKGEKCYIVATGPSLSVDDLDLLYENNAISFSVNTVFDLFDRTKWRPDYYFKSDFHGFTKKDYDFFAENIKDLPCVIYSKYSCEYSLRKDAIPYKTNVINNVLKMSKSRFLRDKAYGIKFSRHADICIYDGATCVVGILQMAYYMGFSEAILIGVDCGVSEGRAYADGIVCYEKNAEEYIREENASFKPMIEDFRTLYRDMKKKRVPMKVLNATRGGNLEVFPRVRLEDTFS